MSNLTAGNSQVNPGVYPQTIPYAIAANTIIYQGQAVVVNAPGGTGLAQPAGDIATSRYVGIAAYTVDNSADNTGGALSVSVWPKNDQSNRYVQFSAVSPLQAWVGEHVFFTDDHTVALAGSTSHTCIAGRVVSFTPGTAGYVVVDTQEDAALATSA